MNASPKEYKNSPVAETCPACIPFCGLSGAAGPVSRLKQCGLLLLEQVRQSKEEQPDLLQHS